MAFRFSKRIKIAPGIKLNLSAKGVSMTVGVKGFSVNVGKNGTYLNTGVPGTGVSNRTKISGSNSSNDTSTDNFEYSSPPTRSWIGRYWVWIVVAVAAFILIGLMRSH